MIIPFSYILQKLMRDEELTNLSSIFTSMDVILNLRAHLRKATDCYFLYWHKVETQLLTQFRNSNAFFSTSFYLVKSSRLTLSHLSVERITKPFKLRFILNHKRASVSSVEGKKFYSAFFKKLHSAIPPRSKQFFQQMFILHDNVEKNPLRDFFEIVWFGR